MLARRLLVPEGHVVNPATSGSEVPMQRMMWWIVGQSLDRGRRVVFVPGAAPASRRTMSAPLTLPIAGGVVERVPQ
jgi:hypothetical protein